MLLYSVYQAFRSPPEDESDGPSIHGHTGLEIAWTVVPAILVIAIGVISAVVLSQNGNAGTNPMTIKVFAQQFAWRFEYPGEKNLKSDELVMPLDRNITFDFESADVIHSFWIPAMGQKQDVVPGIHTSIVITPTRLGNYTLICTELCGLGHATMRAPASVVTQADFAEWVQKKQSSAGAGGRLRQSRVRLGRLRQLPHVQRRPGRPAPSGRSSTMSPPTPRRPARIRRRT